MPTKNENGITFGPWTVYINGEEFGEISDANCTVEPDDVDVLQHMRNKKALLAHAEMDVTFSAKVASKAFTRLCHVMTGIDRYLIETCPNRRVAHLARYAKKRRVREKNYKHMIRICEKGMD